ncbi:SRPBCC domain-containing protein [Kluyvera sp. M-M157-B]|nr:polyketide cyclase [Klebsiella sp. WP8-S18-ESBL-06]
MKQSMQQSAIVWPEGYLPGTTDNFASNEIIVSGLSAKDIWAQLDNTTLWPTYYSNVADIHFYDNNGPMLSANARFRFSTFGFPIEAQITEYVPPADGQAARIAWHGWAEGDATTRLDVIHAWLFEDLPGNRVRILTQESQIGVPAQELARTVPNPMINGHQEWITGLVKSARGE